MAADTTTSRAPDGRFLLAHPAHFIALGFGCGLLPLGPGTWGTFATIPFYWALAQFLPPLAIAFLAIPLFFVGVWACGVTGRDLGVADHRAMCWDEIVSFLPLAALALLLVFGSVVAAGVPIVVGGTAVAVALAVIFVIASLTSMSIFVLNLATLLGLGLGVDYALLLTSRFREELANRGGGRLADGTTDRSAIDAAVAQTVATAGRAVFFSGLTVLLGLVGLMLFDFMILRSVGIAGAVVVGLAVAGALTLLPAGLAILGRRIDRVLYTTTTFVPSAFDVATGDPRLAGAIVDVDEGTGQATAIRRVMVDEKGVPRLPKS